MIEKRSKLGESQTLQQFSRDVDEIEAWISEKLQTATDESYKDPTNIQVPFYLLLVQARLGTDGLNSKHNSLKLFKEICRRRVRIRKHFLRS